MTDTSPAPEVPTRSLGRNIVAVFGSQVTTWVLSTLMVVLVPRLLGPDGVGQLGVSAALWGIVGVLIMFGTNNYLTVEIAKDHDQARPLSREVVKVRIGLFLVAVPLVGIFCVIAGYEQALLVVVAVGAVATLCAQFATTYRATLFGLEQMGSVAWIDVAGEVVLATLVLGILKLGGSTPVYPGAQAVVSLLSAVLFYRAIVRFTRPTHTAPRRRGMPLMKASAAFLFAEAMVVLYLEIDTVIISLIATETEVGWYATANTIFGSLLFVPAVLMTAVFPRMTRLHHERPEQMKGHIQQAFSTMLVAGVLIGIGTVVVAPSLTTTLFGPGFEGTAAVLAVYGFVTILGYQTILLGQFAIATERARFIGFLVLASALLSIPLDLVLVSWTCDRWGNGAIGAALAYIFTEGLQIVVGVGYLAPHLVNRATFVRVSKCAIAGGAMLAVGWPLRHHLFLVSGAIATLVYVVVILALRTLNDFERDIAGRLWSKARGKLPGAKASA